LTGLFGNGEAVKNFGPSCTGQWPVHFYRTAALAAMLGAAVLPSVARAAAKPAAAALARPAGTGQSTDDF